MKQMSFQIRLPKIAPLPVQSDVDSRRRLVGELRKWWDLELADWDKQVAGDDTTGADLWDSMPVVDSKTVARMAPIFKKYEGCPFAVRRIRAGGYASINDAIQDLVYKK